MKTVEIKPSDIHHDGTVYFMGRRVSVGQYKYFVIDGDRTVGMSADAYPEEKPKPKPKPKPKAKAKPKTQKEA